MKKILLVEDEPDLVKLLTLRFQAAGYEVMIACDGQQALDLVGQDAPHLIVLDLMLPKVDGYEVCQRLKADQRTQKIPILVLTARSTEEELKTALDCGADAVFTKPFDPQTLLAKTSELLIR